MNSAQIDLEHTLHTNIDKYFASTIRINKAKSINACKEAIRVAKKDKIDLTQLDDLVHLVDRIYKDYVNGR